MFQQICVATGEKGDVKVERECHKDHFREFHR